VLREGTFVAVVGPSGAGKDTLLNGAAEALAGRGDIIFVRRIITRSPDGATEDHDTLSPEAFQHAQAEGEFSLSWAANGLCYALPQSAWEAKRGGKVVVANVSRAVLSDAVAVFGAIVLIEVTASRDVLFQRLCSRGREAPAEIEKRLARKPGFDVPPGVSRHLVVDNSGAIETGIAKMAEAIASANSLSAMA